ncbi:hypothetical protein [Prauserella cavernicola]|uniref:Secreted protein n=1 Tax=Prauserella cavernicola TaxID=2800127 RepID=A0A934QT48_9PSEU|nr:hypothetical protein [Prauserella cavernicola]MBK1787777.1 hypothetical protein [Prauserella cavernicola]
MMRKLVTTVGLTLAAFGFATAAPALAATAETGTQQVETQASWVYVKWFEGNNKYVHTICEVQARQDYPGRPVDCRGVGSTTQMWVKF